MTNRPRPKPTERVENATEREKGEREKGREREREGGRTSVVAPAGGLVRQLHPDAPSVEIVIVPVVHSVLGIPRVFKGDKCIGGWSEGSRREGGREEGRDVEDTSAFPDRSTAFTT
jgi:hypothetical protein